MRSGPSLKTLVVALICSAVIDLALTAILLTVSLDATPWLKLLGLSLVGLTAWTLIEYLMHRLVLHGVRPFCLWHAQHHERPRALTCTPTLVSATLLLCLVYLPARQLLGSWAGAAWAFGVLTGYLIYTLTHHAIHHGHARYGWLLQQKRWHAIHHHGQPLCYGVTSTFGDRVFGSAPV